MQQVNYNAIVLAGGRSSRLGGVPKAGLSNGSQTLLARTLAAVYTSDHTVVVGPPDLPLPWEVTRTRESPPFSGPAAALAAGLAALPGVCPDWTAVLAVDMPGAHLALHSLLAAAADAPQDLEGIAGETGGIFQPLAGVYRTEALKLAFAGQTANSSVRRHLSGLRIMRLPLPAGSTDDVDTWENALALGFTEAQWRG